MAKVTVGTKFTTVAGEWTYVTEDGGATLTTPTQGYLDAKEARWQAALAEKQAEADLAAKVLVAADGKATLTDQEIAKLLAG